MGVPTMVTRLLAHLDTHPSDGKILARARLFCAGSAALSPRDLHAFEQHTGHRILERYGMSETLMTLSNPLHGERRAGSVGLVVPGYRAAVVDDDDTLCAVGVPGELWVRGAGVMKGYWRAPEATAAAFRMRNGARWFATGDVVTVDAAGYHAIVGRKSTDILKVGGYKIASREIEEAIASHPWIHEVAVVGIPDDEWGQRVVACVVLHEHARDQAHDVVLATLQEHVRLHESKKPRALHVVTALPRNALGKVQKHELAKLLAR
jgi:acyl-CoA synthetase (AMP-forming)/AMP-acid ligase II